MRSWQSVAFEKFLLLRGTKRKFQSERRMEVFIRRQYERAPYRLPLQYQKKHGIIERKLNGTVFYILNEQVTPEKVIYYFHGGAYINDPLSFHWRYLLKLAAATNFTIVVPIYPKLPHATYKACYEALQQIFDEEIVAYEAPIILMGDSAGGGLALGFAQHLKAQNKQCAEQIVLHSPWVDVTSNDPAYNKLAKKDPMLAEVGAKMLGKMWSGGESLTHPQISPIYGDFQGIGRIVLFVGTHELLLVDAKRLIKATKEQGVNMFYFEYPKMNHVFPVFPIPEAKQAFAQLLPLLKQQISAKQPVIV